MPKINDRPAARMKSKAPNEMPFSACCTKASGLIPERLRRLSGIRHASDLVDDGVHRLAVLHRDLADVDVLDDVVRGLVELEVAARTLELDALERRDERVLVRRVALRRLEGDVHSGHAVPGLK